MMEQWIASMLRRPVAVVMISATVAVAGVVALSRLPLDLVPAVAHPAMTVETSWPGMPAEHVEMALTAGIEEAACTVAGVRHVSSVSSEGLSQVSLTFEEGTRMEFARLDLNEKLAALSETFPPGVERPVCEAYVPEDFRALQGFMSYTLAGRESGSRLRMLAQEHLAPRLRSIEGVAGVAVYGGEESEVLIELNPKAIRALDIQTDSVSAALGALEFNAPVGALEAGSRRRVVSCSTPEMRLDELEQVIVAGRSRGRPVRLADIATVRLASAEPTRLFRINGEPAITLVVQKLPNGNALRIAEAVRARAAELTTTLPDGVCLRLESDTSRAIRDELALLTRDSLLSLVCVLVVLSGFFGQLRAPLVVLSSVFLSLAGTMLVFWLCRIGLHLLSLAGLVLGLGRLVDDSIVVLEYIQKDGVPADPLQALPRAVADIALPVVASTVATIGALLPASLLPQELKPYVLEFAFAVGISLLMSLVVSCTVIPVAASRLSMRPAWRGWLGAIGEGGSRAYAWLLRNALRRKLGLTLVAVVLLAVSAFMFSKVDTGEVWSLGRDTYLLVRITFPQGTDLRRCDAVARQVEQVALAYRDVLDQTTCRVEGGTAFIRIAVAGPHAASSVPSLIMDRLTTFAARTGGAAVDVWGYGPGFSGSGQNLPSFAIRILGCNYVRVRELAEALRARLQRHPRIASVDIDRSWTGTWDRATELVARIDASAAARHGLSVGDVVRAVRNCTAGTLQHNRITLAGERVPYVVRPAEFQNYSVDDLAGAVIPGFRGNRVRARDLLTVEERTTPVEIEREDQSYVRWVTCEYRGPHRFGEALVEATIRSMDLPYGYRIDRPASWLSLAGNGKASLLWIAGAAVVIVFMVTAALYESLIKPFIVLLTVPLSLIGLFLAFSLTGTPFGRGGFAAILLLVGIVTGNGIVLVDGLARACRHHGVSVEVIVDAALQRLRPVLMTTLTTVGGLLPVYLLGDKSSVWYAIALGTIGGLLSSMLLTLVVVPAVYLGMAPGTHRWTSQCHEPGHSR